jgi:DnaJ-class molecular chaperone
MTTFTSDCSNCDGTGSVDSDSCATCNGTGHEPMARTNKKPLYIS